MILRGIFRALRFFARCLTPYYRVYNAGNTELFPPAVYIVHHQNLRGPLTCMIWFNKPLIPWVLSVFCSFKECFHQYYSYTFTKRFRMPKLPAAIIAFPAACFATGLMKLIQAIPVFRGTRNITNTFKQSVLALTKGQNILICPDVDYSNNSNHLGEIYLGFLNLDKYYMKQTGCHIPFVPLQIRKEKHGIYIGKTIYFREGKGFKEERAEVHKLLKEEFLRLEKI